MRITHERAMRVMQQAHEEAEAKRSIAGRLYPTKVDKQGPDKAERSITADRKARGAHQPPAIPHQLKIVSFWTGQTQRLSDEPS